MSKENKKTGSFYTPSLLSQYMAKKLIDSHLKISMKKEIRVLDPACGEGDLLIALFHEARKKGINAYLIGIDTNELALEISRTRFADLKIGKFELIQTDFLDLVVKKYIKNNDTFSTEKHVLDNIDLVIANPPYISTTNLGSEKSQEIAKIFKLKGKVDMYQAFFPAISLLLDEKSSIAVITSNKFLTNKTGKETRYHLKENYEISEIVDLGDTKLFSAAVLPSIIFANRKNKSCQKNTDFYSIYEVVNEGYEIKVDKFYDILDRSLEGNVFCEDFARIYKGKRGKVVFPPVQNEIWSLSSTEDFEWAQRVKKSFCFNIKTFGKVRVGIKTTADNVFIKDTWNSLPNDTKPEDDLLYDLCYSKMTSKWFINKEKVKKILYTHVESEGKKKAVPVDLKKYNKAKKYLEEHRDQLEGRSYVQKAKREWFEIWVPQNPKLWKSPKLIFPDISETAKFAFDDTGLLVDGNCYWFTLNEGVDIDYLYLILGVSNSKILERYHSICFQNKLYSNKNRYVTQYVNEYPIPDIELEESRKIVKLVKKILLEKNSNKVQKLEIEIDILLKAIIEHV